MINNAYIFDDVLPKSDQLYLEKYVKDKNIQWDCVDNITRKNDAKEEQHKFPAKVHLQIYCKDEIVKKIAESIQINISQRLGLQFIANYRWKINWTSPLNYKYNPSGLIHRDRINEHLVAVYYINNTTGDTSIFNNIKGNDAESYSISPDNVNFDDYTLLNKVSPKMGRCFVFNGNLAHYGDYPLNEDRWIINFNFATKDINKKKLL